MARSENQTCLEEKTKVNCKVITQTVVTSCFDFVLPYEQFQVHFFFIQIKF